MSLRGEVGGVAGMRVVTSGEEHAGASCSALDAPLFAPLLRLLADLDWLWTLVPTGTLTRCAGWVTWLALLMARSTLCMHVGQVRERMSQSSMQRR